MNREFQEKKSFTAIDLSVVIPVGCLDNDYLNIFAILEESQEYQIEVFIVLDKPTRWQEKFLNEKIRSNNWQNIHVLSGDWGNPGSARNLGLAFCTRTFVAFWDSDDHPDFHGVQLLVGELMDNKYDAGLGRFRIRHHNSIQSEIGIINRSEFQNIAYRIISNPGLWRFIFNRSFVDKLAFPDYSSAEDQLFLQRFFSLAPRIKISEHTIYDYVQGGPNQLTKSNRVSEQTLSVVKISLNEIPKPADPNHDLVSALILKQIITVIKHGNFSNKFTGLSILMKYFYKIGLRRFMEACKLFASSRVSQKLSEKSSVHLVLMGGLGNQLFQLAFGYYMSEVAGKKIFLVDSSKSLRRSINGEPELMLYAHRLERESPKSNFLSTFAERVLGLMLRINLDSSILKRFRLLIPNVVLNLINCFRYGKPMVNYVSDQIGYSEWKPKKISEMTSGYFQSYRYMSDPKILPLLKSLTPKILEEEVNSFKVLEQLEKPLLVHIRLGDYRDESSFGLLSPDYYFSAIRSQMDTGLYKRIWVFSDEIDEYKKYIPSEYIKEVRPIPKVGTNSVSLLEVMRMCKGYVIANSSLSWWAAALSHTENPVVMYPEPWFEGMPNPIDLTSPNWIPVARNSC